MRRVISFMILLILFVTACNLGGALSTTQPAPPGSPCGDGVCQGPENPVNCPTDCRPLDNTQPPASTQESTTDSSMPSETTPVLYLGIMVHLEGWEDDQDQAKFEQHVRLVREYADLFERYNAKLTLESKEMTEGILQWGDNVLLEMEGRGHGIGVHADIGGQRSENCETFATRLRRERVQLETLGVTVRHVSGNTSHCDWVAATIEAGYLFTTGQVAYSLMSLPFEDRPPEYRDCPNPGECHDTYPPDLADRIHPWRTSNGADWLTHDPEGELVILSSSQVLPCMQDELEGGDSNKCDFDLGDIDTFQGELERAIDLAQPDHVNIYYVAWSLGSPLEVDLLENLLQLVQPYVERGQVEWKTIPEMYDAYVRWEQGG